MLKGMDAHDADIVADDIYCISEGTTFDLHSGTVRDHRGFSTTPAEIISFDEPPTHSNG